MANFTKSPCRPRRRFTSRPSDRPERRPRGFSPGQGGFSLSEALVALAVTSLVFLAALSMLSIDNRVYHKDDALLEVNRESRFVLERLENDLLMAGFLVDKQTIADAGPDGTAATADDIVSQASIVYAAPYEVAFNADQDPGIEAIDDTAGGDSLPTGYAPVTFHTGAETIRYTLDSNGDGSLDSADRGDDLEETVISNPNLYLLYKEIYGDNGTDNTNPRGPVGFVRGPGAYPTGAKPMPLFLYWGNFYNRRGLTLWGDTGAGGGTAYNGVLEAGELAALGPVTDEDADDDNVIDSGEDRNGNGVLERRITDLIRKVDVHVTGETAFPDMNFRDPVRSTSLVPYRYRVSTLTTEIKPRNIELPGGACGDQPQPISGLQLENACAHSKADGKVRVTWNLSSDDGGGEMDVEKYIIYRTDVDSVFGTTPCSETAKGVDEWVDEWIEMRTWPPRQYWYRLRSMDCTPQLSTLDPVAGGYPAAMGAAYPQQIDVHDVPGDDGTTLEVLFSASPDETANTSGYGGTVEKYYVHRSENQDYRCVPPVHDEAIEATGAPSYTYTDDSSNSTAAPVFGTLYYYWMRSEDNAGALSPYSPRFCARPYQGPVFPVERHARVAWYGAHDHPVEISFSRNPRNTQAGYDEYLLDYNIYRARDANGDGTLESLEDESVGYRASELQATINWTGLVYAAGGDTDAVAHMSLDGGFNWRQVAGVNGFAPRAIAFGTRLDGVLAGDGGTLLRTHDGGASWTAASTGTTQNLRSAAFLGENIVIAAGENGTVLRSVNAGNAWTELSLAISDDLNGVAAAGNLVLVVGENGAAARSLDGGANWTPLSFTSETLYAAAGVVQSGGQVTLWAGASDRLYHSADGGDTWDSVELSGAGPVTSVACAAGGPAMAAAPDSDAVYRTVDGSTWSLEPISPDQPRAVAMLGPHLAWVCTEDSKVYSRGSGGSWTMTTVGAVSSPLRALAVRPELAWEDSTTTDAASGRAYFYVVTTSYAQGGALDGEAGMIPDRPGTLETPDDGDDQILVDSCNNIELAVQIP